MSLNQKLSKLRADGYITDDEYKILKQEPVYYPPCIDCNEKMDEIRNAYDKMTAKALEQEPTTKNDLAGDIMDFPNTFDEFAKRHQIVDNDEHYSNGIEYIPVFRVNQWLEHISTTKNDLGVEQYRERMIEAFHNANCGSLIALVVQPTEKEFEHLEWLLKTHYKTPQEPILDKIRAEIETLNPVNYVYMSSYDGHRGASDMKDDVLAIIDKYRVESEE